MSEKSDRNNTGSENRLPKLDSTFIRFLITGVINTVVGTSVMLICYNVFGLSYWVSSAANYIVGSICSYILNKHFTFRNKEKSAAVVVRFVVNIAACYLIAYGLARPLVHALLSIESVRLADNVAMLFGTVSFTLLNYFGQKLFVFRSDAE